MRWSLRSTERTFLNCPSLAGMNLLWYIVLHKVQLMKDPPLQKIPLIFYRTATGSEPVREWLKGLGELERRAIGKDLLRAQWRWPVGMPLCRPLGNGLWEVRTNLPTKRTARVLLSLYREHLVAAWVHQENAHHSE